MGVTFVIRADTPAEARDECVRHLEWLARQCPEDFSPMAIAYRMAAMVIGGAELRPKAAEAQP
jgi:hypothetical protein